jgi:hypothetical protein
LSFKLQKNYWDQRYASGGSSGKGSIGPARDWKWGILERYLGEVNHVIDYGCGDLSFWEGRTCSDYLGIDVSDEILRQNRLIRPEWKFLSTDNLFACSNPRKPVVLCFDVLFHVIPEDDFLRALANISSLSSKWIFVYTWLKNPFNFRHFIDLGCKKKNLITIFKGLKYVHQKNTDGIYQKYRPLSEYYDYFKEFKLLNIIPYPNDIGGMYVFKRHEK